MWTTVFVFVLARWIKCNQGQFKATPSDTPLISEGMQQAGYKQEQSQLKWDKISCLFVYLRLDKVPLLPVVHI